jgi:hypothetical protein
MLDRLAKALDTVIEALSTPLKVALVFLYTLLMVFWLFTIRLYGYYSAVGLAISQVPIVFLVVKEIRRQMHLLPKTEGFELNSEQMDEAIREYVEMIERKRSRVHHKS